MKFEVYRKQIMKISYRVSNLSTIGRPLVHLNFKMIRINDYTSKHFNTQPKIKQSACSETEMMQ